MPGYSRYQSQPGKPPVSRQVQARKTAKSTFNRSKNQDGHCGLPATVAENIIVPVEPLPTC
jgi:hypothetical protein